MNITLRTDRNVAILDISGRLVMGEALYRFRNAVRDALNENYKHILLNLENVNYMDSSGVGELVQCYTTICTQGGSVKLLKATQRVSNLLHMTKLLTVFETFNTEPEALASFHRGH